MKRDQFLVHADAEMRHWWFKARRKILSTLIASVLPTERTESSDGGPNRPLVIDVGCGTGGNTASLSSQYECVGIDTAADAIALARKNFPDSKFICGFAPEGLKDLAKRADLFLMSDVLEHIEDDFWALSHLMASAKVGAYFLLTVPADRALWSGHDESHGHYRRYDQHRFEQLWEGLPIETLLCTHMNSRLYPVIKLIRQIGQRRGRTAGDAGTDVKTPNAIVNKVLETIFAGERHRLGRIVSGRASRGYAKGVSLVALLKKVGNNITARVRPSGVAPDMFDPTSGIRHAA